MKRLKTIFHYKWTYYLFFIIACVFSILKINQPIISCYNGSETLFKGVVTSFQNDNGVINVEIMARESLKGTYFLSEKEKLQLEIGDIVNIKGSLQLPKHNTVFDLFDYSDYLKGKGQYWTINIDSIEKVGVSRNILFLIKRYIIEKINFHESKTRDYLNVFLIGNQSGLSDDIVESYRDNGISHLFSISGMHLSFLSGILLLIIGRVKFISRFSYLFTCVLLIGYMLLVGCSASVVRACMFFIFRYLFGLFKIDIPIQYIFIFMVSIILFFNPSFIIDVGFQYSVSISYFLLISNFNKDTNYFMTILKVSFLSFFVSLPISLYYFYHVNLLGILYNLFFVPFVSLILFPLSFIVFLLPCLDFLFCFLICILENLSLFLSTISYGKLIFMKPMLWWIIIYYLGLLLCYKNRYFYIFIFVVIVFLYFYPLVFSEDELLFIDVGQGDSILMQLDNRNILIDTGGKVSNYSVNSISNNILLPLFESSGIRNLDYLILTHGDYDHMGEAINLVENFKVEKVIFNCGEFNELEQELIKVLDKKKIPYYSCIKELNIDDNKLYFINSKDYDNENDSSSVIYSKLNNHNFLFMGDAGAKVEEDLIQKYNLKDVDVLKVGHHGSKTSSGKEFIDEIKPKYSIISVGNNNRYGHPNDSVLNNLANSKIYRTDQDGSILFKIKKNKLKIETCSP